jgi:hypothetical protein
MIGSWGRVQGPATGVEYIVRAHFEYSFKASPTHPGQEKIEQNQ